MLKTSHCVILAAGKNTRLDNGIPKSLTPLTGETIIQRHIRIFSELGISSFCVIGGYEFEKLEERISGFEEEFGVSIELYLNDDLRKENGYSVHCASAWVEEKKVDKFFLTMGDHVFEADLVRQFMEFSDNHSEKLVLAVDNPSDSNSHIDFEDVTKVEVDVEGKILKIGKELSQFNRYDTGLFRMRREVFQVLQANFEADLYSISNLVTSLGKVGEATTVTVSECVWNDVDNAADLENTVRLITEGKL